MSDTKTKAPRPARGTAKLALPEADDKERVAKVMARAGLCSRRDAEQWIKAGRVAVNGVPITSPALNVGADDTIAVDGQPIAARERTRLFLYHKPRGLVTTAKDPEGRPTVFDNLPEELPRVVSVGRLDINTEGLLLLTNDGGLARVLELPATGWLRRYRVRANGSVTQDRLDALRDGITIDGVDYLGISAELDRTQGANVWLTMGLREGKNREIKRVLEHLGLTVNRLIRLSFGPFSLGELAEGDVEEVRTRVLKDQLGDALVQASGAVWDDAVKASVVTEQVRAAAPPRQPGGRATERMAEERPRVDRPKGKARPHVSVLRAERAASETEPRKRIARKTTEDRKGRVVAVERVTVARKDRHTGEGGTSRNARNFARERREALFGDAPLAKGRTRKSAEGGVTQAVRGNAKPAATRSARPGGFGGDRPATGRALKDAKVRTQRPREERDGRPPRGDGRPPSASGRPSGGGGRPQSSGGRPPRSGGTPGGSGGRPPRSSGAPGGQGRTPRGRG